MRPRPTILLLAAGASARMGGRDKLLEPVGGQPLIRDRARAALLTGAPVLATLPPRKAAPDRWAALAGLTLHLMAVSRPERGLSASLAAGIAALPADSPGALVMLADMPEITQSDLAALLDGWDGATLRRAASADGQPGNPVLFPAASFGALRALSGDRGARDLLANTDGVELIPLPAHHALTDIDTPEDWARWRATP